MLRSRVKLRCNVCNQTPALKAGDKHTTCACSGRVWNYDEKGVDGSEEEARLLTQHGYVRTTDIAGDIYYVGTWDIIHLFAGGTWNSEKAPEEFVSLEDYLTWRSQRLRAAGL